MSAAQAVPGVELQWPRTIVSKASKFGWAQWAAIAAAAMIGVDPVVNSFVLPEASKALDMSSPMRALASSIATLILTAGLLGAGALGDKIGRRRVMVLGIWVTLLGEVISTLAVSSQMFILGRAVVGIGMAGLFGMAIAMIPAVTAPEQLAKVYGKMFACTAIGGLIAILSTGVLNTLAGWRVAFGVNVVCAVIVAVLVMFAIPENRSARQRAFDYKGVVLAALALLLFMYGLGQTAADGWLSAQVLIGVGGGIVLFIVFVLVERRLEHPSFPLSILGIPAVVAAVIALVGAGLAQGTLQANITELMGDVGYSSTMTSVLSLPMVILGAIGALWTGNLVSKGVPVRRVLALTVGALVIGMLASALINSSTILFMTPIAAGLVGFGMQSTYGVGATIIMRSAPIDMLGSVGTVKPVMGQLGYGIGLGAIVPIITIFTANAEQSGASETQAAYHGFSAGMFAVFLLEIVVFVVTMLVLRSRKPAVPGSGVTDPMLPPNDHEPAREAALLEARGEAELP